MRKRIESISELKGVMCLILLPIIYLVMLVSFVLQVMNQQYTTIFYLNALFIMAFTVGWVLMFWKQSQRVIEYYLLWLVVLYYVGTLAVYVFGHTYSEEVYTLISFSICMPLIILMLFMIMEKFTALWISNLLLVLSIIPGVIMYPELDSYFISSLIQLYISTALHIFIIFFMYDFFRIHGEMKVMQRQFYLDPLTQIGNRYQVNKWMKELIKEEKFSVLFFDIDRFKSINDQFGHKVGDDVLKKVVRIVQAELRKQELFARWGGEEFIIFLKIPEYQAFQIADRLRIAISKHDFDEVGQVTASFGVTAYQSGDTADTLLIRVDELLYVSKESGRNRVTSKMVPFRED